MSSNPVHNHTNMRSSQPNQSCYSRNFQFPLISFTSLSAESSISVFLVNNCTIVAEDKVKSSLSISPCHNHKSTPSTVYTEYSIHPGQHMPSGAYTKYSIHQVQHTPSIVSTQDCVFSLHSQNYEKAVGCSLNIRTASQHDRQPSASSPSRLKGEGHKLMNNIAALGTPSINHLQVLVQ